MRQPKCCAATRSFEISLGLTAMHHNEERPPLQRSVPPPCCRPVMLGQPFARIVQTSKLAPQRFAKRRSLRPSKLDRAREKEVTSRRKSCPFNLPNRRIRCCHTPTVSLPAARTHSC